LRQIRREGHAHPEEALAVSVHPEIAELLATSDQQYLDDLEKRLQKKIIIKPRERFHIERYEIRGANDKDREPESKDGPKDSSKEGKEPKEPREPRSGRGGGRKDREAKDRDH